MNRAASTYAIAAAASARIGLDPSGLKHVRTGSNALYRCGDVALRAAPPGYDVDSLAHQLTLTEHLLAGGFPTPAPVIDGWLDVDGHLVTAWEWVDSAGPVDPYAVGELTRHFHEVTSTYGGPVPEWDPLARARTRLRDLGDSANDADMALIQRQMESLSQAVHRERDVPWGLVHGDIHDGNVLPSAQGLRLIDFERFSAGPLEWDMAQRVVGARFFNDASNSAWEAFLAGYGPFDLSPAFEDLVVARALVMTTWLLSLPRSEVVDREREARMEFWRRRDAGATTSAAPAWSAI